MRMTLMMCASLLATRVLAADEHVHEAPAVDMPHAIAVPEGVRAPSTQEMAAAFPDLGGMQMKDHMGSTSLFFVSADRLEAQREGDETAAVWEAKVGWGGDHDRLWLESSGERVEGESESLETRLYWTRAVSRWWDAAVGLRQDGGEGDPRRWVSVGVQGLAPYFVETQLHLFVGESGRTALAVELEYDARLTQRLILQPRNPQNGNPGSFGMGAQLRFAPGIAGGGGIGDIGRDHFGHARCSRQARHGSRHCRRQAHDIPQV